MSEFQPKNDFEALWLTLFGEARGEPIEGIIAVGNVIQNRIIETGKSYLEVCTAGVDIYNHQFSCWNQNDPNLEQIKFASVTPDPICKELQYIARGLMGGFLLDNTHGSNHYITMKLYRNNPPSWARGVKEIHSIGSQVFFYCR